MSRERELLQRALDALEKVRFIEIDDRELLGELYEELRKPEPVEIGSITFLDGIDDMDVYLNVNMPDGKYRLFAERIKGE